MRVIRGQTGQTPNFLGPFQRQSRHSSTRKLGVCPRITLVLLLFQLPLYARCPIPDGGTLAVRAPVGNLLVDTRGKGFVDVEVSNKEIRVQENCSKDRVELTGTVPRRINGSTDWRITVPKSVNLDLVTDGGSIQVGDSDANVTLRTTGGSVSVGQIRGRAAIVTQGGSIKTGNIGSDAELRSQGGSIEAGNVAGNAEFQTLGGPIDAGAITGRVNAQTAGGSINIRESGEITANTLAGNIIIGNAGRTIVRTAGGNIIGRRIRGPFEGRTEAGDIRLESVAAWVEAITGSGNIFARMAPDRLEGDLHMTLQTGMGDIMLHIPERLPATIEAIVQRPSLEAEGILSEFSVNTIGPDRTFFGRRLFAPMRSETVVNGGGNRIKLETIIGKIEIKKIRQ